MKSIKNILKQTNTTDKLQLAIFSTVMTILTLVVISWAHSGFISTYGF